MDNVENTNNFYWKLVTAFTAGLLIGIGSTWLWFTRDQNDLVPDTSQLAGDETELDAEIVLVSDAVSTDRNWVVVEDQFPGNQVQLTAISFSSPGWIAIYEDRDGEPGNILGAQWFDAGEHTGIVDLTRGTEEGSLYYAILHNDNGDRKFDFKIDIQLLDENGKRVETKFQTPPHRN